MDLEQILKIYAEALRLACSDVANKTDRSGEIEFINYTFSESIEKYYLDKAVDKLNVRERD